MKDPYFCDVVKKFSAHESTETKKLYEQLKADYWIPINF